MSEFEELVNQYWKYYIALEKSFLDTERYVEFDYINNGETYSLTYMQLFQSICSEVDVVGKILARKYDEGFKPNNSCSIYNWWYPIYKNNKDIVNKECVFVDKSKLVPWEDFIIELDQNKNGENKFKQAELPKWWNEYNGVKHKRTSKTKSGKSNYMNANLKNVVNAFAGLYVLETALLSLVYDKAKDGKLSGDLHSSLFYERLSFYACYLAVNV